MNAFANAFLLCYAGLFPIINRADDLADDTIAAKSEGDGAPFGTSIEVPGGLGKVALTVAEIQVARRVIAVAELELPAKIKEQLLARSQRRQLLGVNQKRASRIEGAPGVTSFDQIARLISALGGRLVVEVPDTEPTVDSPKDSSRNYEEVH